MATQLYNAWRAALTLLAATGQQPDSSKPFEVLAPYKTAIEVLPPPYGNVQGAPCVVPLGQHEFGFSYGTPFVGTFPPVTCDDKYSLVYLKWEASSPLGVQFDRIAAVWINGVELLRTSTEEPDRRTGVIWEVAKDISRYYDVVKRGGDFVIALDNVMDSTYNSSFTVTLSAEFFQPQDKYKSTAEHRPDVILPIGKNTTTSYGWFTVEPSSAATGSNSALVTVPRNTEELYLEVFLSHHQCDEFYYGNPPNDYATQLGACGNGPFREVQVLVDDELAGVVWPFPLLFTGGLNPYLWRPIVAIGAFQAPTYLVNLTPFLHKFVDAKPHNITFFVDYGIDFWPIDGNLLVYVDKHGKQTQARVLEKQVNRHVIPETTESVNGLDANFTLTAKRDLHIKTSVTTSKGTKIYDLSQRFEYANAQEYRQEAEISTFDANTVIKSTLRVQVPFGQDVTIATTEEYPISGLSYYKPLTSSTYRLEADLSNAFSRSTVVRSNAKDGALRYGFESKDVLITLSGTAVAQSGLGGNGTTEVAYRSRSPRDGCFVRQAAATLGNLIQDDVSTDCSFTDALEALELA
ncbi:hypothetical protein Poli38472_014535 [Pythium oligandrum]|uniref:Peptide N-acetyl-beta-D-glucosaminyl asparaginase amidase A N-terminal domain-containing protein n=2 Tax=Pythiaceae TaxID=4782 RepID=A0A8K1CCW5_PYTOL|nr:hypothetical protein Poli38472_014535 [Pythium oligandrum]DBA02640.1 TPA: hypothetical protein N0F65_012012 [Lagenidium giganteum]|eukprot:TMW61074.1 hypothetical protein Poli38472_014535 [Pythium oligandrum]